jgi:hypothetical protein
MAYSKKQPTRLYNWRTHANDAFTSERRYHASISLERLCETAGCTYGKCNFEQNKTLFLHVAKTNISAKIIRKLGFETRREISIWNISQ